MKKEEYLILLDTLELFATEWADMNRTEWEGRHGKKTLRQLFDEQLKYSILQGTHE